MSYSLVISIVPHDSGDLISNAANDAGAAGGTILMGRGTASNSIIQLLGFGDTSKDLVYVVVPKELEKQVIESIKKETETKKAHFGICYAIDTASFLRAGEITGGKVNMTDTNTHQMITIIVNKGYAEDAMAAARKAGAGGGTIIGARGTAREGDAKFFGMEIVPEKDMLIILVENEKVETVLNAVKSLDCLSQPGSGVAFCSSAHDFTFLGAKK